MVTWSHSRISTYESCPYKYKLHYIDKIEVDIPTTIEAFMGSIIHKTMEKIYKDAGFQKVLSLEEVLSFYDAEWAKEFSENILVAKEEQGYSAENYKSMGQQYLKDYYARHTPFNEMKILGLETEETFKLDNKHSYHIRIDKLGCVNNTYYICDYKTNSRMKDQAEADEDRQLAMYSLWVRHKFKDAEKVILKWHMLKFDKDVTSERSEDELQVLRKEVLQKIIFIEEQKDFPTNVSALCDYCVYKHLCPSFKHEYEIEQKELHEFKEDEGVKLVDKLAELTEKNRETNNEMEKLKEDLAAFALQKGIDKIYGSNKKVSIKELEKIVITDSEKVQSLLKEIGLWDEVSSLNYSRLMMLVKQGKIVLGDLIKKEKDFRVSLSNK